MTTVTCEQYPQYNIVRYNTTQTSLDFDLMGVVHPKVPHPVGGIWTPICYTVFVSASLHPSLHLNPSFEFDLMSVVHPKVPHSVGGGIRTPIYYMAFCVHKSTPQSASQSVQPILHFCDQQTDTDTQRQTSEHQDIGSNRPHLCDALQCFDTVGWAAGRASGL